MHESLVFELRRFIRNRLIYPNGSDHRAGDHPYVDGLAITRPAVGV